MKKTAAVVVTLLTMSLAGSAMAAPAQTPNTNNMARHGYHQGQVMTEEQKAQFADHQKQMVENRKQMLQLQVERGVMTQEQANQRLEWMEKNMGSGTMMGGQMGAGKAMNGAGMGMMRAGQGKMGSGMGRMGNQMQK